MDAWGNEMLIKMELWVDVKILGRMNSVMMVCLGVVG